MADQNNISSEDKAAAERAANLVGVTPNSDMRPFVVQAALVAIQAERKSSENIKTSLKIFVDFRDEIMSEIPDGLFKKTMAYAFDKAQTSLEIGG